jgi:hypothetical protein
MHVRKLRAACAYRYPPMTIRTGVFRLKKLGLIRVETRIKAHWASGHLVAVYAANE